MAKGLTIEEKHELLALKQEELSISIMSKLFGKTAKKIDGKWQIQPPKFDTKSPLHLDAGEYINQKEVDTTVGSFLFNKIMVEGMLEPVIPNHYYNEVVNKKGFKKLVGMLSEGLMMGKISVDPTLIKWLKQYEFYGMKAVTIFSPSYTEGLLKKNVSVMKEKQKLLKEKKGELSPSEMTEIEDTLVKKSHDILKNDPGLTLYDSGGRGSFDNDYKNMNLMLGPVAVPGEEGQFDMVTSNYIEGLQKSDMVAAGNMVVNAAHPKAIGTQVSGYQTKQYYAAYQSIQCDEEGTDCGTKMGLDILLTEDEISDYYFQYIIKKDGKVELLTPDNKDKFVNKKVKIRSPMFCKTDKTCNICSGQRYYTMGIKNSGLTTGRISNTLLNQSMKNFHIAKVNFDEVDISDLLI